MNILFIGGNGNYPNANSVCVNNLAREMIRLNHKVWILAMGDEYVHHAGDIDGAELWQIPDNYYGELLAHTELKQSFFRKLMIKLISIVRHILILPTYPNAAPVRAKKVAKKALQLVHQNSIGLVIAIFNRYENIYAGMQIKKSYGNRIKVVSYHLDLRTASVNPSSLIRSYIYKHSLLSLVRENNTVDKMLIPYSGQKDLENLSGLDKNKIRYVGLPVYIINDDVVECKLPFIKGDINICYVGTLSSDNRNPSYFLSLLEAVQDRLNRKVIVHFWGEMNGLEQMLDTSPVARYHGKIDNCHVRYIMLNSDFLLNIGNAIAYNMLPSKVFTLFATGKPIINIIAHPNDATMPYFNRYGYSIDILEYKYSSDDIDILTAGIQKMYGTSRSCAGLFDDFTPGAICKLIAE